MLDNSLVVTSMSDNCLILSDPCSLRTVAKVPAHQSTINRIETSKVSNFLLFSASNDKKVRMWDTRTFTKAVMEIGHSEEYNAVSVGVEGSLLAAACNNSIFFYDIRCSESSLSQSTTSSTQSKLHARKLGIYGDVHSDMITQLKFHPVRCNVLVSAAEDGLICSYDTSTSAEEEAIMTILNSECPVGKFGFFGAESEGIYSLSTIETASFWHFPSAQRVAHFLSLREELSVDYLVDCFCAANSNDLYMLAGNYSGRGVLARIDPSRCAPLAYLQGGHSANIRCAVSFPAVGGASAAASGESSTCPFRILTGGEDARLCSWSSTTTSPASATLAVRSNVSGSANTGSVGKAEKNVYGGSVKSNSKSKHMHFKPY